MGSDVRHSDARQPGLLFQAPRAGRGEDQLRGFPETSLISNILSRCQTEPPSPHSGEWPNRTRPKGSQIELNRTDGGLLCSDSLIHQIVPGSERSFCKVRGGAGWGRLWTLSSQVFGLEEEWAAPRPRTLSEQERGGVRVDSPHPTRLKALPRSLGLTSPLNLPFLPIHPEIKGSFLASSRKIQASVSPKHPPARRTGRLHLLPYSRQSPG